MGAISAFKAADIISNVRNVLAIEFLCAAQGLDFIKGKPGTGVVKAHSIIREKIPMLTQDRMMSYDIQTMVGLVSNRALIKEIEGEIGPLY
jgi:histidine ammonia-lyase